MSWRRYVVNTGLEVGELLAEVRGPEEITTAIYGVEQAGGWAIYMRDELSSIDALQCIDPARVWALLSRGLSLQDVVGKRLCDVFTSKEACRSVDREEAAKVIRRLRLWYGVLTPLFAWDALQDAVVRTGPDGEPVVSVRVAGLGDAYHRVYLSPNECPLARPKPRRLGLGSLGLGRLGGGDEEMTLSEYLVNQASEGAKIMVTAYNPVGGGVDARLNIRVTAYAQPVAQWGLTVRRRPPQAWTMQRLVALNTIDPETGAKLLCAFAGACSRGPVPILVYGPIGSGKTTLTEALINSSPPWLAVTAIQDVSEYVLDHPNALLLNTRQATGLGARAISKADLIGAAMRSGAMVVVVNEILEPTDANAWFLAVTTGHGGATTIHAGDRGELLARLRAMGVDPGFVDGYVITVGMRAKRVFAVDWPSAVPITEPPKALIDALLGKTGIEEAWLTIAGPPGPHRSPHH